MQNPSIERILESYDLSTPNGGEMSAEKINQRVEQWSVHTLMMGILWDRNVLSHQRRLEQTLKGERYAQYVQQKEDAALVNPWNIWFPATLGAPKAALDADPVSFENMEGICQSVKGALSALVLTLSVPTKSGNALGSVIKLSNAAMSEDAQKKMQAAQERIANMSVSELLEEALEGLSTPQKMYYKSAILGIENFMASHRKEIPQRSADTSEASPSSFCAASDAKEENLLAVNVGVFNNPIASYPILDLSDKEWDLLPQISCPMLLVQWIYADGSDSWYMDKGKSWSQNHVNIISNTVQYGADRKNLLDSCTIPTAPTERTLARLLDLVKGIYWLGSVDSTPLSAHERFVNRLMRRKLGARGSLMEQVTTDVYFSQAATLHTLSAFGLKSLLESASQKKLEGAKENRKSVPDVIAAIQAVRTKDRNRMLTLSGVMIGSSMLNGFAGLLGAHAKAIITQMVHPAMLFLIIPYMGYKMINMGKNKITAAHQQCARQLQEVYGVTLEDPVVDLMQNLMSISRPNDNYHMLSERAPSRLHKVFQMVQDCPNAPDLVQWLASPLSISFEEGIKKVGSKNKESALWCKHHAASIGVLLVWAKMLHKEYEKMQEPDAPLADLAWLVPIYKNWTDAPQRKRIEAESVWQQTPEFLDLMQPLLEKLQHLHKMWSQDPCLLERVKKIENMGSSKQNMTDWLSGAAFHFERAQLRALTESSFSHKKGSPRRL